MTLICCKTERREMKMEERRGSSSCAVMESHLNSLLVTVRSRVSKRVLLTSDGDQWVIQHNDRLESTVEYRLSTSLISVPVLKSSCPLGWSTLCTLDYGGQDLVPFRDKQVTPRLFSANCTMAALTPKKNWKDHFFVAGPS